MTCNISKKRQFSIYLSVENEPYFVKGNARELDKLLSFLRKNSLSFRDLNQIINLKSEIKVYYKIKNTLLEVDDFLGKQLKLK